MKAPKPVFSLAGPRDLMKMVEENFAELEANADERRLLNCVLSAWHMADWVWRHWLSDPNSPDHINRWASLGATSKKSTPDWSEFSAWLARECPVADHLRLLANHAKHAKKNATSVQQRQAMMFPIVFGTDPAWSIENDAGVMVDIYCRQQYAGTALNDTIQFWKKFLRNHHDWV